MLTKFRLLAVAFGLSFWGMTVPFAVSQESLPALIKRIEPSVVVVMTASEDGKILGQGTGFFLNREGDVITNHHVLEGAGRAEVRTNDGKVYPVKKILADDREGDLIRVSTENPGNGMRFLSLSRSFPEVGERIFVIGTPLGLEKTVSDGIVSAVREIADFGRIIQLTAPISQGSSGSPVVNMKGEVVGVATFFVVAGQNLNFAIPTERIMRLAPGEEKTLAEWERSRKDEVLAVATELYLLGLRHLWIEDYERALLIFTEVVKRNPNHADAYFQIGYCMARLGRYKDAVEPYRQAILLKPEDVDSYNNLCVAYNMLDRYDDAIASCTRAVRLKPGLGEAHNNLCWAYHKVGRYQESIESCQQAIRLRPDFALAYYNLGNNYFALKYYLEAIESYKLAIRINPDHAEGHLNLGASYYQVGRYEDAIESYKQAVRLRPDSAKAHLDLGMVYLKLGDRGSAFEEYKILKGLDKESANRLFNLIYD